MADKNMGCCGKTVTETTTKVTAYGNAACDIEPGTLQYIGARYVPIFADPATWNKNRPYEHLMMVQYQGDTYISKQAVPAGVDLPTQTGDSEYWILMSNWNAQIEQYREEVMQYVAEVETFGDRIDEANANVTQEITDRENADKAIERVVRRKGHMPCQFIAHRGVMRSAPENTLESFSLAKQYGYNLVEFDVWKTADNVWVVFHDATLNRMTAGSGNIWEYTYSQLMNYPITKGQFQAEYEQPIYIPTLDAVLRHFKKLNLTPVIEIKNSTNETTLYTQEDIDEIISILKSHQLETDAMFLSYEREYIKFVKKNDPKLFAIVVQKSSNGWNYSDLRWICNYCNADGMMLNGGAGVSQGLLTEGLVNQFHSDGFYAAAFGAYSNSIFADGGGQTLMDIGCDYIVVNDIVDVVYQGNNSPTTNQVFTNREEAYGIYLSNEHEKETLLSGGGAFFNAYTAFAGADGQKWYTRSPYRISTMPKRMQVGTVIQIDPDPRYQYTVIVKDVETNRTVDTGWVYEGRFMVPRVNILSGATPTDPSAETNAPLVSIMVSGKDNTEFILAERDLERIAKYIHVLNVSGWKFLTLPSGTKNLNTAFNSYRRMAYGPFLCAAGDTVRINPDSAPEDNGVKYAVETFDKNGNHVTTSGWLTATTDYTLPTNDNIAYYYYYGANTAANQIKPQEAYAISQIPNAVLAFA